MKWVNLAVRQPDSSAMPNNNLHFRLTSSGERIPYSVHFIWPRDVSFTFRNRTFDIRPLNEVEWLDESAYNIKDHDPVAIRYVVLTEQYDDLKEEYEALKAKCTSDLEAAFNAGRVNYYDEVLGHENGLLFDDFNDYAKTLINE